MSEFKAKARRVAGTKDKPTIGITIPYYAIEQNNIKIGQTLKLRLMEVID